MRIAQCKVLDIREIPDGSSLDFKSDIFGIPIKNKLKGLGSKNVGELAYFCNLKSSK